MSNLIVIIIMEEEPEEDLGRTQLICWFALQPYYFPKTGNFFVSYRKIGGFVSYGSASGRIIQAPQAR